MQGFCKKVLKKKSRKKNARKHRTKRMKASLPFLKKQKTKIRKKMQKLLTVMQFTISALHPVPVR